MELIINVILWVFWLTVFMAIASFIIGIFFGFIGLVFGIIGAVAQAVYNFIKRGMGR
jgi:ABC-type amino acid transport system permease subunit